MAQKDSADGTGAYPLVSHIQRFSLHDGPGIRTTVFLKGCSVRCPWCANPENIAMSRQRYVRDGAEGIYGRFLSCDEILAEVMRDRMFYGEWDGERAVSAERLEALPGGITFSGGEALLQADRLEPLFRSLREERIHMVAETSLFVVPGKLEIAMEYIDLFYIDVKILDGDGCRNVLSGSLWLYLDNLERVFGAGVPAVFRIPVIGGYTDTAENQERVLELVGKYRPAKAELIKGHRLGASKYASLGLEMPDYGEVSDELLEAYRCRIEAAGVATQVCKI